MWSNADGSLYKVLHFDNSHPEINGAVVDTPLGTPELRRKYLRLASIETGGDKIEIPIFMLWQYHGRPCEQSSAKNHHQGYPRVTPDKFEEYRNRLSQSGFRRLFPPQ